MILWRPAERVWTAAAPAASAVPLADARTHARVPADDDALLTRYLAAAVGVVEARTQRMLTARAATLVLPGWPPAGVAIELPGGPVGAGVVVSYRDADGVDATLDAARYVVVGSAPARLEAANATPWPALGEGPAPVTIGYTAGHATCPAELAAAVLMIAAELNDRRAEGTERRVDAVPFGADQLMAAWRIRAIG